MYDKTVWQFINSFAPWLSAFGTILAVIVALYLARRDRKIKFSVYVRLVKIGSVPQNFPINQMKDYIAIDITNKNYRTATLTNIYWKIGMFQKGRYDQLIMPNNMSSEIPIKLYDGDVASYRIPLSDFRKNLDVIKKGLHTNCIKLETMFIFVVAVTSTGHKFKTRIPKSLREWFLTNLNRLDASNQKC